MESDRLVALLFESEKLARAAAKCIPSHVKIWEVLDKNGNIQRHFGVYQSDLAIVLHYISGEGFMQYEAIPASSEKHCVIKFMTT